MRTLIIACILLVCGATVQAQLSLSNLSFSSDIKTAVEKVLTAYVDKFAAIRGDTITATSSAEVYESAVKPKGALECTFTHYKHPEQSMYLWEAIMLKTEDFSTASKRYHSYYQQLKNISFRGDYETYRLQGDYYPTDESKNFYSTVLTPVSDDEKLKKLRLEILLDNDMIEWTLKILIYDRDHAENEAPVKKERPAF